MLLGAWGLAAAKGYVPEERYSRQRENFLQDEKVHRTSCHCPAYAQKRVPLFSPDSQGLGLPTTN